MKKIFILLFCLLINQVVYANCDIEEQLNIFHDLYKDVNISYKDFKKDERLYNLGYVETLRKIGETCNPVEVKQKLQLIVDEYEQSGKFKNYKTVDLFSNNLYELRLWNKRFFCNFKGTTDDSQLDTLILQVAQHNDRKKQAKYNREYFQKIFYGYRGYFEYYYDALYE